MCYRTGGKVAHVLNDDLGETKAKLGTLILVAFTAIALYLCYQILKPFFPVLSWALAIAIVSYPLYARISQKIRNETASSMVSVILIGLLIVLPIAYIGKSLFQQAYGFIAHMNESSMSMKIQKLMDEHPSLAASIEWLESNFAVFEGLHNLASRAAELIPSVFTMSLMTFVQILLVLFTTFFLYRDKKEMLSEVRHLLPLSDRELTRIFKRISDTVYATLYGTLVVATVQGALGGIMFWFLGLPAPALWGAIMAFLALIPYLGTFVVWAPAAAYLFLSGETGKALILTAWGGIVVSLIDNLLYPLLVGKRLRFHTLLVFFFILGGLAFFGTSGLILGPLSLSIADALIDTWKARMRKTSYEKPEEEALAL
jgi:predicted PurR-regulated permease PerM